MQVIRLRLLLSRALFRARASSSSVALASKASNPCAPEETRSVNEFAGKKGQDIIHEMLIRNGVTTLFGYPGGTIMPTFDAIYGSPKLDFVLSRHEQGAGHMAAGYGRMTGRPGVSLVSSGPGATNSITPLQCAKQDGTPMVVITGQVPRALIGTDGFQEANVLSITKTCTKWNIQVQRPEDLQWCIDEAFKVATSGRPGPVLIDIPKDVQTTVCSEALPDLGLAVSSPYGAACARAAEPLRSDLIDKVVQLLSVAKRPVIYAGQGVIQAGAHAEVHELVNLLQIPITTTLHGMGIFPESHPLSLKMLGMHGTAYANRSMQAADLIIAVGARFDDRITGRVRDFAKEARRASKESRGGIVHLEIEPYQVDKIVPTDVALVGDCKRYLRALNIAVRSSPVAVQQATQRQEWLDQIASWKAELPFSAPRKTSGRLAGQHVLEELDRQTRHREDVFFTTGVGQHQMWACQFIRWGNNKKTARQLATSGGLGTMGYGLPAAIGAKLADPSREVIDIDGDSSFLMTMIELATAVEYKVGVKVLLMNNEFQGMVKQWQDLIYERRYSGSMMKNPNFVKVVEGLHARALRCDSHDALEQSVAKLLEPSDIPVVLECLIDKDEHVYPMVPAGASLDEMLLGTVGDPRYRPTTSI